jgi:DNA-binding CsgD family transcriptional regulator
VVAVLRPLLALHDRDGVNEPGVAPWQDLLVDALAAVGDCDQAAAVLDWAEARAAARGRRSAQLAAARARGTVEAARGNPTGAERAFQAGLGLAGRVDEPFSCALLNAAYGRFLRRAGRRSQAATHLRAAQEGFTSLDARPYLERCDRELAACGLTPAKRRTRTATRLTPQELAVARLVASGMTNQQAASELVVSVKTVEYHLGKVYAKLSITSRGELAGRLDP